MLSSLLFDPLIQYARNLIADPQYEDEEFAMDWVMPSEENLGSE